ncbi:hypothetical protein L208DRAFT_63729 [Tricholoma matsutake]|nr:hypothetical protein L208DRAFT_63729 [Tricholoma matsutake 945]
MVPIPTDGFSHAHNSSWIVFSFANTLSKLFILFTQFSSSMVEVKQNHTSPFWSHPSLIPLSKNNTDPAGSASVPQTTPRAWRHS